MATGHQKQRMFRSHVEIPVEASEKLVEMLNQHTAEALDLYSQLKHAHWNLKGKHFFPLHSLTDEVAAEFVEIVDDLAERAVALGGCANGTIRMATDATTVPEYPADIVDGMDYVRALVERLGYFANQTRAAIDRAEELGDKNTADLYNGISRLVDKRLWFFEAHLQGEGKSE